MIIFNEVNGIQKGKVAITAAATAKSEISLNPRIRKAFWEGNYNSQ